MGHPLEIRPEGPGCKTLAAGFILEQEVLVDEVAVLCQVPHALRQQDKRKDDHQETEQLARPDAHPGSQGERLPFIVTGEQGGCTTERHEG